jgi:hypothetical protein
MNAKSIGQHPARCKSPARSTLALVFNRPDTLWLPFHPIKAVALAQMMVAENTSDYCILKAQPTWAQTKGPKQLGHILNISKMVFADLFGPPAGRFKLDVPYNFLSDGVKSVDKLD